MADAVHQRRVEMFERTKCFLNRIEPKVTNQLLNQSKQNIRICIGLITGHCKVNSHLVKLRLRDDPDCDLCGLSPETAEHLISTCPTLCEIRSTVYGKQQLNTQEILANPVGKLINFHRLSCEKFQRFTRIF